MLKLFAKQFFFKIPGNRITIIVFLEKLFLGMNVHDLNQMPPRYFSNHKMARKSGKEIK